MHPYRSPRKKAIIKKELSYIIQNELDFDGALVTLISVDVVDEARTVKCSMSIIPAQRTKHVLSVLKKSNGYIKRLINKKLDLGRVPNFVFHQDKGTENVAIVEEALHNE